MEFEREPDTGASSELTWAEALDAVQSALEKGEIGEAVQLGE